MKTIDDELFDPTLLEPRLNTFIPHMPTPRQAAFLLLECREAFYGGAGGGGKSDALLMAALQYADIPGYSALIIRRNFAELALPNALIDRAHTWLRGRPDGRWNEQRKQWKFSSGATLTFGYLEGASCVQMLNRRGRCSTAHGHPGAVHSFVLEICVPRSETFDRPLRTAPHLRWL